MVWGIGASKKDGAKRKGWLDLGSPGLKQDLLWTLIQNVPVAYSIIDKSYRVRFVNDQMLRLRRLERGDVLGEVCYNLLNGGAHCQACVVGRAIEEGVPHRVLRKDIMPDGSVVYADDFAVPVNVGGQDMALEALVDRTLEMLIKEKTNAVFLEVIRSMIKLLEKKDPYTSRHCREVAAISSRLTQYMGLGNNAVYHAMLGGLLHDLGKLHVPDTVLNKRGRLEGWEMASIKEHPVFTYLILPDLVSLTAIRDVAISHHEKWDGTGYPNALQGDGIPVEARIAAVADTYSAMTSDRPYRKGMDHETAMAEIKKGAGTQFDPHVVEKFVQMVEEQSLDRRALIAPEDTTAFVQMLHSGRHVQRRITRAKGAQQGGRGQGHLADSDVRGLADSASFTGAILDATPATFMVIDECLNVLYASGGFARARGKTVEEVCAAKCFDAVGGKAAYCFEVKDGCVRCPAVRAFATGKQQRSLIREEFQGRTLYYDTYAVPVTLGDAAGNPIKCCLQILFDMTSEKLAQNELESDLRRTADTLYHFVTELDHGTTGNIEDVSDVVANLNDYLEKMQGELADMLASQGAG